MRLLFSHIKKEEIVIKRRETFHMIYGHKIKYIKNCPFCVIKRRQKNNTINSNKNKNV